MAKDTISQYLQVYAEAESRNPALINIRYADAVLVIPAYMESTKFLDRLAQQTFSDISRLLLILVSNHPHNLSNVDRQAAIECHSGIQNALPKPQWQHMNLSYHIGPSLDVLLVDRNEPQEIDEKQGVGLARKIGVDMALSLIDKKKIKLPWIFTTDADVHLPKSYFSAVPFVEAETAAFVYPFRHTGKENSVHEATKLYELRLGAYVEGLKYARSPYAFQTLGSTLCISPKRYAQARGFPKRNAGEDFYLLNKLAKLGQIGSLKQPIIEIESRCSDRIPFGTGPAVSALVASSESHSEKIFYDPKVFEMLKTFIELLDTGSIEDELEHLPSQIQQAAEHINIDILLKHLDSQKLTGKRYRDHVHLWFDGFRTLKFLHFLRDNYFPNISYYERYPK